MKSIPSGSEVSHYLFAAIYIVLNQGAQHYYYDIIVLLGIGAALGQLGWWSGTFFMGEVGPILLSSPLKTSGTFYFFAGMYILAILHILLLLPETKVRVVCLEKLPLVR